MTSSEKRTAKKTAAKKPTTGEQAMCNAVVRPRLIAADVALAERLPAIALLFISNVDREAMVGASEYVKQRFRRIAKEARAASKGSVGEVHRPHAAAEVARG